MKNEIDEVIGNSEGLADAAVRICTHLCEKLEESGKTHILEINRARDLFWSAGLLIVHAAALCDPKERDLQQANLMEHGANVDYQGSGKIH